MFCPRQAGTNSGYNFKNSEKLKRQNDKIVYFTSANYNEIGLVPS